MTNFLMNLFEINGLHDVVYSEPYAGGAGAAINLLLTDSVSEVIINDANIGVYSFWYWLLNDSEKFIQTIEDINVTLTEWRKQREILKQANEPSLDLGIATFFLSRTNRSGVITGGAIGGASEEKQQTAHYKIDCRFNKSALIQRLQKIVDNKKRIKVFNLDALDFLRQLNQDTFVYLDPPYYAKGKYLYMNHYTDRNHKDLACYLLNTAPFKWILSYDDTPQIRSLYSSLKLYRFPLKYTVEKKRTGYELLTHSANLKFPVKPQIRRYRGKPINILPIIQ